MSNPVDDIIRLGHDLSEAKNAAFDLWTWLPSAESAKLAHGDYYSEKCPPLDIVMKEAAYYIARLKNPNKEMSADERDFYSCPCGEEHGPHD